MGYMPETTTNETGKKLTVMTVHSQEAFSGIGMPVLNSKPYTVIPPDKPPYGLSH